MIYTIKFSYGNVPIKTSIMFVNIENVRFYHYSAQEFTDRRPQKFRSIIRKGINELYISGLILHTNCPIYFTIQGLEYKHPHHGVKIINFSNHMHNHTNIGTTQLSSGCAPFSSVIFLWPNRLSWSPALSTDTPLRQRLGCHFRWNEALRKWVQKLMTLNHPVSLFSSCVDEFF